MKVKELLKFLEVTDPEVEVKLKVFTDDGMYYGEIEKIRDDVPGVIFIEGEV